MVLIDKSGSKHPFGHRETGVSRLMKIIKRFGWDDGCGSLTVYPAAESMPLSLEALPHFRASHHQMDVVYSMASGAAVMF